MFSSPVSPFTTVASTPRFQSCLWPVLLLFFFQSQCCGNPGPSHRQKQDLPHSRPLLPFRWAAFLGERWAGLPGALSASPRSFRRPRVSSAASSRDSLAPGLLQAPGSRRSRPPSPRSTQTRFFGRFFGVFFSPLHSAGCAPARPRPAVRLRGREGAPQTAVRRAGARKGRAGARRDCGSAQGRARAAQGARKSRARTGRAPAAAAAAPRSSLRRRSPRISPQARLEQRSRGAAGAPRALPRL